METATAANTSANKRTRFDATAQSYNQVLSPLALATGHVRSHTASLLPEIQDILNKLGIDYIKLRHRADQKVRRIQKMSSEEEYIPNSARFNFELRVSSDASIDPDFVSLQDETNALLLQIRLDLKQKVIQAASIDLKVFKAQAANSLASGLHILAKTLLIASGTPDLNPHKFVNTLLDRNHESILLHLDENLDSFRNLYKTKNAVAILPNPFPQIINDTRGGTVAMAATLQAVNTHLFTQPPAPAPFAHQAHPPADQLHENKVVNMFRIADAIFIQAWKIFLDATLAQERRLALKKINQDLLTTAATEDAQMDIDCQPTLDSHTINDLVNKKTSQQTKPMKADITWIKSKLALLEPKNNTRGPGGASSNKKQNAKGKKNPKQKPAGLKADAAASDSKKASGNKKKTTSNKRSPGNSNSNRSKNPNRSGRSGNGSS
jgi:hypothetical protein